MGISPDLDIGSDPRTPVPPRTRPLAWIVGGAAVAGVAGLLLAFPPGTAGSSLYPPCPFRTLTGLDCPFCGGLRATHALLTGDIATAADRNILVPLLALAALVAGVAILTRRLRSRPAARAVSPAISTPGASATAARRSRRAKWLLAISVALAVFWIVRNLPFVPFLNSGLG